MSATDSALSASMENYLEAILLLIREHEVARSKDIAERLQVKRSSVTGALQALRERGHVNYEPYGAVTLTSQGRQVATRILRRHEALRDFFTSVLSVDASEANEVACRLEHGISKHIVDRLLEFAEFMRSCPRAGPCWVKGRGCKGETAQPEADDCEECIAECLESVRAAKSEQRAAKGQRAHARSAATAGGSGDG